MATTPTGADEWRRTDGLSPLEVQTASISGGEANSAKLSGEHIIYPVTARQAHISGEVAMRAIIGIDGLVQRLRVESAPSSDLAMAALTAARTYRYKPYLVNGLPTPVETTITTNFRLSP